MEQHEITLVLSGSGFNFMAHIGAIDAIVFSGITIKHIVCVSGGALAGALYSIYGDDKWFEIREKLFSFDITGLLSKKNFLSALLSGYLYNTNKLDSILKSFLGDYTLGRLPIPLTVIATDWQSFQQVAFSSLKDEMISVFDAVRSSIAVPGLFKPHNGYVDGGLVNNIPIDFAVDNFGSNAIGVKVVSRRVIRNSSRLKIIDVLIRSIEILMNSLDMEHVEDNVDKVCFIKVPYPSLGLDFNQRERNLFCYNVGYYKMRSWLKKRLSSSCD